MADDYSQVVLPTVLVNIGQAFLSDRHNLRSFEAPVTAKHLLEQQTAQMNEVMKNGECIGFEVAYQIADQDTIGSGSGSAGTPACTLSPDQTFSGLAEAYNIDRYFRRTMKVLGKDCDSAIKFRERLINALRVKSHEIALAVNNYIIAQVVANIQTATNDGEFGTGITAGVVDYSLADIQNPTLQQIRLQDWRLIGIQEKLPSNMLMLHGTNFWNYAQNARFNNANDDQRSQMLSLMGNSMSWDVHGFGGASIENTSFLIDPNAFAFLTRNHYPTTPVNSGAASNETHFAIPLTYIEKDGNGQSVARTMQYMKNGRMQDVMLDVRLQYQCDTTNTIDGLPSYNWVGSMQLAAAFVIAPNVSSSTGIVQIDAA
jgi:hypothetical protein